MIRHSLRILTLLLLFVATAHAETPATQPVGKTVHLLAIGNSFSANATAYLRAMTEAGGHKLVFGHAMIPGSSFERHLQGVAAFEANPEDPAAKPYKVTIDGKAEPVSLKYLLESKPWEYVTIQQASALSYRPETFEPSATKLVEYVRRYAPQAKLLIHETWAYRGDEASFKPDGLSQQQMYALLHVNYAALAKRHGATGVIPVGTAFQNVREDVRWKPSVSTDLDLASFKPPTLPKEDHELNVGWAWNNRITPAALRPDRRHASSIGKFLGACVWYESFFGDARTNTYRPTTVSEEDAVLMREIAHETVQNGLLPKAVTALPPTTAPTISLKGENDVDR